ncbi:class I SAM-dependent RNA methyltransferase [Corynebacterium kutscheri]|uniref:class I SAM-dependent RNA methyltransferase n=1 Tax=Corynebacterium kutscheri TaxID=35755 RepID=UPI000A5FADF6|nr:RNA methyltransferase [Corynebacterium kutscheri]VEH09689.1 SAM-dependent methyltransferase [Corynebacterium kutscheri]
MRDQLQRVGGVQQLLVPERIDLQPSQHWRTRIRLGVDEHGRAGVRKRASNEIIIGTECSQAVTGLFDAIKDVRFSPGSEVVAVKDDFGEIHVVEISKAPRGRRSEKITRVISGDKLATQIVDGFSFRLPATGFWQAHIHAAQAYSDIISRWLEERYAAATTNAPVAWDLYGGVGVFVPALARALGNKVAIHSVESSPTCARSGEEALVGLAAKKVTFHSASVEKALGQLPHPHVVVLDPPRTGAGEDVIRAIATTDPQCIVHIGCDPATFARDIRTWSNAGYTIDKWVVVNAFPGTHHVEVLALLRPANLIDAEKR